MFNLIAVKKKEYSIFKDLVLKSAAGDQKNKETLIELVKIAYTLIGKGKGRKRTLDEILEIVKDKEAYFNKLTVNYISDVEYKIDEED